MILKIDLPHQQALVMMKKCVLTSLIGLLLLSSCASIKPQSAGLQVLEPSQLALGDASNTNIEEAWWERFQNKALSDLITSSLENNPSIALANTRIEKAQALAGITRSATSVQMGASLDLDRQRFSQAGIYPPPLGGSMQSLTTLQLSGAWIPDVFGKYQASYKSAMGQVQASALEALHAKNQLSAQISLQFIALALSIDERDMLLERKKHLTDLRQLLNERVKAGLDASLDLKGQDIELNDLSTQLSQIETQIDLSRHLLATLSARAPLALMALSPHLSDIKAFEINAALGIGLLGRRADVVAAKSRVYASLENVEAAKLDFYPNISLGFFSGFNTLSINQLTQNASAQYGLVPSVNLPIFDGGRLNAQLSAKSAEKDQAIAIYNSTLLDALKEASDALSIYKATSLELQSTQNSWVLATQRLEIQSLKTKVGLGNQTSVLKERISQLQLQRAQAQWNAKHLSSAVLLLKSLGAGWPQNDTANTVYAQKP
jgi:NodT family efflux transporter outer membrane factor (OMF) lipoprotein